MVRIARIFLVLVLGVPYILTDICFHGPYKKYKKEIQKELLLGFDLDRMLSVLGMGCFILLARSPLRILLGATGK